MPIKKSMNGKKLTKMVCIFLSISFVVFLASCGKNYPNDTGYKAKLHTNTLEITGYTGAETNLSIPHEIGGFPVTYISSETFMNRAESVIIPESVIKIGKRFIIPLVAGMKNKLVKITIGQNVEIVKIGGKGTDGRFDRFRSDYEKNNKKAGTYLYKDGGLVGLVNGGTWTISE